LLILIHKTDLLTLQ